MVGHMSLGFCCTERSLAPTLQPFPISDVARVRLKSCVLGPAPLENAVMVKQLGLNVFAKNM